MKTTFLDINGNYVEEVKRKRLKEQAAYIANTISRAVLSEERRKLLLDSANGIYSYLETKYNNLIEKWK